MWIAWSKGRVISSLFRKMIFEVHISFGSVAAGGDHEIQHLRWPSALCHSERSRGISKYFYVYSLGGSGMARTPTRAKYSPLCKRLSSARSTIRSVMSSKVETSLIVFLYSLGGSGIVLNPTRARYSSACNRSLPARSIILSKLSIEETSSSCSVRNHCKKLIVM